MRKARSRQDADHLEVGTAYVACTDVGLGSEAAADDDDDDDDDDEDDEDDDEAEAAAAAAAAGRATWIAPRGR